ncbi:MAG: GIY-YIG nuclease family protein [Pseudomonadota bacterium]
MLQRWSVYMIEASDGRLYTGVSTDPERRFSEHQSGGRRAARFFRGRSPRRIAYVEAGHTRSSALKREAAIKKLSRREKLELTLNSAG